MYCDKGMENKAVFLRTEDKIDEQLIQFEGHGVAIMEDRGGYSAIGCLNIETRTLITESGGMAVSVGQIIVHTPGICRDGIG